MSVINEAIIKQYKEDGAVCIRNVFDSEWVRKVAEGIEENLRQPSEYSERLRTKEGPGYYFNDYCNWRRIRAFSDFVYNSPCSNLVAALMCSQVSLSYSYRIQ